jgi:hypothetical protein
MSTSKSYTRVVSTEDGGTAFEDVELQLDEQPLGDAMPPMSLGDLGHADGVAWFRFAAFPGEPHPASGPQWVIVLRGTIEVEVSDGTCRRFGAGDLVFAADTSGTGHITRVVGAEPVEALGIVAAPAA